MDGCDACEFRNPYLAISLPPTKVATNRPHHVSRQPSNRSTSLTSLEKDTGLQISCDQKLPEKMTSENDEL